jgi:hypothetical protein
MQLRLTSLLALLLILPLAACGGSHDPEGLTRQGYAELNSGRDADAEATFRRALEGLDPAHPQYLRAQLGLAQAQAARDPEGTKQRFLDLARTHPVEEVDYQRVAGALTSARHFEAATDLVVAGMTRFPESPRMVELRDHVGDSAQRAGSDVPDSLKGLGYVGSD